MCIYIWVWFCMYFIQNNTSQEIESRNRDIKEVLEHLTKCHSSQHICFNFWKYVLKYILPYNCHVFIFKWMLCVFLVFFCFFFRIFWVFISNTILQGVALLLLGDNVRTDSPRSWPPRYHPARDGDSCFVIDCGGKIPVSPMCAILTPWEGGCLTAKSRGKP